MFKSEHHNYTNPQNINYMFTTNMESIPKQNQPVPIVQKTKSGSSELMKSMRSSEKAVLPENIDPEKVGIEVKTKKGSLKIVK
jgi:hypothetical protein